MSDELNFGYSLDIGRLLGPAGEASRALGTLESRIASAGKALEKLEQLASRAGGMDKLVAASARYEKSTQRAASAAEKSGRKIADEWEKMAAAAERAEQKKTAAIEREAARQAAAAERSADRIAKANAKAAARAAERDSHKSYFGGEKSLSGLFGARADSKISGIATGAADAVLGAPGALISGAFGAISSIVSGGASLALNFGKMAVAAQATREESVEGFKAIYGSADKANELFDSARKAAKETKFDTKDVVALYNTAAAAGFGADQLEGIGATVMDVSSARGQGKGQQYLRGLAKLNAQSVGTFGSFQQAAMAGPGLKNAEVALGAALGLKPGTDLDSTLRKMFRDHKVGGPQALDAVISATTGLYDKSTGKAGEYAKAQGDKSWSGVLSNIKNGLGDVLNMQMPESHPINRFKTLLQQIGSTGGLFDETSQNGQRFASLVSHFVEDIFLPFGGITLDNTGNVLKRLLDAGEALESKFKMVMKDITQGVNEAFEKDNALGTLAAKIGIAVGGGIARGFADELPGWMHPIDSLTKPFKSGEWSKSENWETNAGFNWSHLGQGLQGGAMWMMGAGSDAGKPKASLASGGVVPGPFGSPQLILAHGGEIVSGLGGEYLDQMTGGGSGGPGGGGDVYNFNFYGCNDQTAIEQAIYRTFAMMPRNPSAASLPG